jgi:flagellar hook-associated protein 1 FlgK
VPDLLALLGNAANSLAAQRALGAVAGHNIQNANTPGYARQRAELATAQPAEVVNGQFIGRGAVLQSVIQIRDRFVEAQIGTALANAGSSQAEADALSALRALDPGAAGGLGEGISGLYAAIRGLAQNPGDLGLRTAALGAARTMAHSFNRAGQDVARQRDALDVKLGGLVDEVNTEARAVADLNVEIRAFSAAGGAPNDLLDLRQGHIDRLAELTGAAVVATSDGDLNLLTPQGAVLVAGSSAATLSLVPDPTNGGHLQVWVRAVDGSGPTPLPGSAFSGSVGGTLAARDGALRSAARDVDALAFDLANALNAVHRAGVGLDGVGNRDLFAPPAQLDGAAMALAVSLTAPDQLAAGTDPTAPGDARNAQALLATESSALTSSGRDVQATLSGIISAFGSQARRATAFAAEDRAVHDHVMSLRESASGVSIDEELIQMQKAQRGYEAITKVIQTADEMLQTLMQLR